MNRSLLILATLVLLAVRSPAADPIPISKEAARDAIMVFRQDPLAPQGRAAGEIVRSFAEKTDTVLLKITPKLVPFQTNLTLVPEDRTLLLDAYIIGNVDSQLLRNEKKDDPYSGVSEVIQTYRQMQKQMPTLRIPEVEILIDLDKRGELKQYVASP
jgi:hypothetical protein